MLYVCFLIKKIILAAVQYRSPALARLCSATGIKRLFIDPKCKYTIESLEKFFFKPGTQIPDKGEWDHMFDAASYCIQYMFPLRKDAPAYVPQRWGHRLA